MEDKARVDEALRRKLHNQIQELKGNIRVICRVRPLLGTSPHPDSLVLFGLILCNVGEEKSQGVQFEFNKKNPQEMVITTEDDGKDLSQRRSAGQTASVQNAPLHFTVIPSSHSHLLELSVQV